MRHKDDCVKMGDQKLRQLLRKADSTGGRSLQQERVIIAAATKSTDIPFLSALWSVSSSPALSPKRNIDVSNAPEPRLFSPGMQKSCVFRFFAFVFLILHLVTNAAANIPGSNSTLQQSPPPPFSPRHYNGPYGFSSHLAIKQDLQESQTMAMPPGMSYGRDAANESGTTNRRAPLTSLQAPSSSKLDNVKTTQDELARRSSDLLLKTQPSTSTRADGHRSLQDGESICDQQPLLFPVGETSSGSYDERVRRVMGKLITISGRDVLKNVDSPQYKAACWILHDDERRVNATDERLAQRYALAVFYYAANGGSWSDDKNFLSSDHECSWTTPWGGGVTCDTEQQVVNIDLAWNNVSGTLVPELSQLANLERLDLQHNIMHGTIPEEIGQLTSLKHLDLKKPEPNPSSLVFEGQIPHGFGELSNLAHLDLSRNNFDGRLPEGQLSNLAHLDLSRNNFDGRLPEGLYKATSLTHFDISENSLTGTLPASVGNLTALSLFSVALNYMNGTIPEFDAPDLTELYMDRNDFSGFIPSTFSKLVNLEELFLGRNRLSGNLTSIGVLPSLKILDLQYNSLTGSFPASIADCKNLRIIRIEGNNFSGVVPPQVCDSFSGGIFSADCLGHFSPPKLECDSDCCTSCSGPVHSFTPIGDCPGVVIDITCSGEKVCPPYRLEDSSGYLLHSGGRTYLGRRRQDVKESICVSPTDCLTLQVEDCKETTYKVHLPGEVLSNDCWGSLQFGYSIFTETLVKEQCNKIEFCGRSPPAESRERKMLDKLARVSSITDILDRSTPQHKSACWIMYDDKRRLNATDVFLLEQRYVLALLHYSNNAWDTGEDQFIPPSLNECDGGWKGVKCDEYGYISEINLVGQNLRGVLPSELGAITSIKALRFAENLLQGRIPFSIANLWNLRVLDVSNNNLVGTISPDFFHLSYLEELDMSNNLFRGSIANRTLPLESLQILKLRSNFFTGTIPEEISKATRLTWLDLTSNDFDGTIFQSISSMSNLRGIQLSGNSLTGKMPQYWSELTELETLMLHDNHLTGSIADELAELMKLRHLTLSHNSLKGRVPSNFSGLDKLSLLHLHGNRLSGTAPNLPNIRELNGFIADCRSSNDFSAVLSCPSCTVCCNSDGTCEVNLSLEGGLVRLTAIVMCSLIGGICFIAFIAMTFVRQGFLKLRPLKTGVRDLCGDDSVYFFCLTGNRAGWALSICTVLTQVMIFLVFIIAADVREEDSDWQFKMTCPPNSLKCNYVGISPYAWLVFALLMFAYLARDFIKGAKLIFQAVSKRSTRCLLSGTLLFSVSFLSLWTSVFYNIAIATTNTELIYNAVILLFVNEIDEKLHSVLATLFPAWVEQMSKDADRYCDALTQPARRNLFHYGFTSGKSAPVTQGYTSSKCDSKNHSGRDDDNGIEHGGVTRYFSTGSNDDGEHDSRVLEDLTTTSDGGGEFMRNKPSSDEHDDVARTEHLFAESIQAQHSRVHEVEASQNMLTENEENDPETGDHKYNACMGDQDSQIAASRANQSTVNDFNDYDTAKAGLEELDEIETQVFNGGQRTDG